MKLRHLSLSIGLLLILVNLVGSVISNGESIPTVYYFSYEDQAFVTQSVDGDKQILFPFEHTEGVINGAGWSPSGNWFMWYGGYRSTHGFIANMNNKIPFQFYESESDTDTPIQLKLQISFSQWHPTKDLLLLHFDTQTPDEGNSFIRVYDPNKNEYILDVDTFALSDRSILYISWSPEGDYILLHNLLRTIVINLEGEVVSQFETLHNSYTDCEPINLPQWYDDNILIHKNVDGTKLVFTNIHDNSTLIQVDVNPDQPRYIDVSPDRNYILIYALNSQVNLSNCNLSHATYMLWELSMSDGTTTLVNKSVQLTYLLHESNLTAWNDNGKFFFITYDEQSDTQALSIYFPDQSRKANIQLQNDSIFLSGATIRWHNDNLVFLQSTKEESENRDVVSYSAIDSKLRTFTVLAGGPYFSPIVNHRLIINDWLVNVIDGKQNEFFVDKQITQGLGNTPFHIDWHPSGHWFLSWGDFTASANSLVSLGNAETLTINELTICIRENRACYGWMPENS